MMGLINSIAYVIGYGVIVIICFSIAVLMVAGGVEGMLRANKWAKSRKK